MLELRRVEVVYNKLATAISGVSLQVADGSITALLGTNGAGKTTTLKAISGFLGADNADITDGSILLDGEEITGLAPHRVATKGVALVPERDKVFDSLTVHENLRASVIVGGQEAESVYDAFPPLSRLSNQTAGFLSGGEKQMLAMGMALLTRPRLLLIDELSLGLAPVIVQGLLADLQTIQSELELTVLLVEQNALAAMHVADYAYVIEDGRIVFDGQPAQLMEHGDIKEFYLGTGDGAERRSYRDVRQYRRKRRWWG